MSATRKWQPSLYGLLLVAANTFAASPYAPPVAARDGATPLAPSDEQQVRPLLDKLTELSQLIERNSQSPDVWRYHLEQAELLLRLAARSEAKEREGMLRMAVDGFYSAALLSPREQSAAFEQLRQLPYRISQYFPGSPVIFYAVLQEIQADCFLVMEQTGGDRGKSEQHRCERLLQFARQHPAVPEAAKAVLQAAQTAESLGQTNEACRCYHYLAEHFPNDTVGRKSAGALWRLGQDHQPMALDLAQLYPTNSAGNSMFNLDELRGRLVVVYFWDSTCVGAAEDFQLLKQLTDRYAGRGLEVVYVNMDSDPALGRAFLSGKLTAGVHLHQAGGLNGPIAERYGLQQVPQAFLVGRDGTLLKHSLSVSQLEPELADRLPRGR